MEYFNLQKLGLPADIWLPFAQHYESTRFIKNQMIYFQDSGADCFYYLKSGRVKTYISSEDGTEKSLTVYHAGSIFGEAAFFGEMPRVSSAVALAECEIIKINRKMAETEMAKNPALTSALLKYLARTVQLLSDHVDDMAFLQADQRIARYLLSLPRSRDGMVVCTQDEIASSVSANRVTVCRILKRFQEKQYLSTKYGGIQLYDPDALEQLIER